MEETMTMHVEVLCDQCNKEYDGEFFCVEELYRGQVLRAMVEPHVCEEGK